MTHPSQVDPEFERRLEIHQALIRSGMRRVISPVILAMMATVLVPILLSTVLVSRELWPWLWSLPVVFVLGFCATWSFHYRLLAPWYRDAIAKATDLALLHDLGIESKLLWPPDSFFGRREAPLLERIRREMLPHPPATGDLPPPADAAPGR